MTSERTYTAKEIAEVMNKSKQAIMTQANKEGWPYLEVNGNGGKTKKYPLATLPADVQCALYNKEGEPAMMLSQLSPSALATIAEKERPVQAISTETILPPKNRRSAIPETTSLRENLPTVPTIYNNSPVEIIPSLAEAAFGGGSTRPTWTPETAISEKDLQDPRIRKILAIMREVDDIPRGWSKGRRKWIESVAIKNEVTWQAIYRWISKYEKRGIAGLRHEKSSKGKPRVWTPEALDWWISLCAKREHRHIDRKSLYEDVLMIEAGRRGWQIGEPESANWWFKKKWNPLMEAMQRGGLRALDNALPPVLRDYSDLQPFEMLVGDQHRFDFWVMDEETGQVFRPEAYLWQDLRTRIIYGAAVDKKYDAWLIGLALRLGIHCYGAFSSIYTDNGKPELSKFVTAILANMRSLGMEWQRTEEVMMDVLDMDGEDINPHYIVPGTHRKAIVKNAKAKMIEGTFNFLEGIMTSRMRLPGNVKRLSDDIHWQDMDQKEAETLAKTGKLLTDREFALTMYLAIDYYNRLKHHRGVHKEWAERPKPAQTTPFDCLRACYDASWRPRMISGAAADLIFLAKDDRVINRGRIHFDNDDWESDGLLELKGRVDIRYNPMIRTELHVFRNGDYICTAYPVEKSSMKDMDLAARKIQEKRERRKKFAEEFKRMAAMAPDFREYSQVPEAERVAALIGNQQNRRQIAETERTREITQEELDAQVAALEAGFAIPARNVRLPERPGYFLDEINRFEWCIKYEAAGGTLEETDQAFVAAYETRQTPDQREYWQTVREFGG